MMWYSKYSDEVSCEAPTERLYNYATQSVLLNGFKLLHLLLDYSTLHLELTGSIAQPQNRLRGIFSKKSWYSSSIVSNVTLDVHFITDFSSRANHINHSQQTISYDLEQNKIC